MLYVQEYCVSWWHFVFAGQGIETVNVTLCSSFRNASSFVGRYQRQAYALAGMLEERRDCLTCVWGEGDSTDDTLYLLQCLAPAFNAEIIDVSHGGQTWGSVVHPDRFKQLAFVANRIWQRIPADADVVIWAESDLTWEASTILALIDDLEQVPCVAPMVMHKTNPGLYQGDGPFFYDVWGHRRNGMRFTNEPPYHADLNGGLLEMDSVGSCVAMNAGLARHLTWPEEDCIVGLCRKAREYGASIWCNSGLAIFHP